MQHSMSAAMDISRLRVPPTVLEETGALRRRL
jgi:hypothetical protein